MGASGSGGGGGAALRRGETISTRVADALHNKQSDRYLEWGRLVVATTSVEPFGGAAGARLPTLIDGIVMGGAKWQSLLTVGGE